MIHFDMAIDSISDYQRGRLPSNAVRLDTPPTMKETMRKTIPIMAFICILLNIAVICKVFSWGKSAMTLLCPLGIVSGFAAGLILMIVHELLHAAVYPKEAEVTVGRQKGKLLFVALASYPLRRTRFLVMSLLPFVLGIVPLTLFLSGAPEHDFLNWFFFGMAAVGMVSPSPDIFNVWTVCRQSLRTDCIMFYEADIYRIPRQ